MAKKKGNGFEVSKLKTGGSTPLGKHAKTHIGSGKQFNTTKAKLRRKTGVR